MVTQYALFVIALTSQSPTWHGYYSMEDQCLRAGANIAGETPPVFGAANEPLPPRPWYCTKVVTE